MKNLRPGHFLSIVSLISAATSLISPEWCRAAPTDSTMVNAWSDPSWGQFLKIIVILAVIIVLIWITLSLLKRSMGLSSGAGKVEMAGGISLGARRSIQFVKIGSALYLLGITDQQVNLIHIVHDPQEIESILTSRRSTAQEPFSALLRKLTGKTGKT